MAKKLILDFDDAPQGQYILGIVSALPHLEFVHHLNQSQYFSFERSDDFETKDGARVRYFICFRHFEEETEDQFLLIKNKGNEGIIGKELAGFDYILSVQSTDSEAPDRIAERLTKFPFIQIAHWIKDHRLSEKTKQLLF